MDYSKSGSAGLDKRAAAAKRHLAKGAPPRPAKDAKAEMLERLREAARKKAEKP